MTVELPPAVWQAVHSAAAPGRPWPPADDAAADLFLAQAAREGLGPLLFAAPDLPPALAAARARQAATRHLFAARAGILLRALGELGRVMEGEPFVVLKGADYMWRLYPRPDLRPMQDLDVLVPHGRVDAVCARLRAGGLQPRAPRGPAQAAPSYYERAFLLGDVIVEVHHSFLQRSRLRVDYEAVWERRRPCPAAGASAFRLDDADAVAYHALALAKDEFSAVLVRYVDWWLLLRGRPDLLAAAAGRAREWRARRAFFGALRQSAAFFPELATPEVQDVGRTLLGPLARAWLAGWVLPPLGEQGRAGAVSRGRQLWRKFWLMDGLRHRLAFAAQHARAVARGGRGGGAG
jgi:hypothetical protein